MSIIDKLEAVVFGGIVPLRDERKRRKEAKKENLEEYKQERPSNISFQIIYWTMMPFLFLETFFLVGVLYVLEWIEHIKKWFRKILKKWWKR